MPSAAAREIAALRLAAQRIATSRFESPGEVVRWMFAMQAQDFPGSKWSVATRMTDATDDQIEEALERREFVRSWPMRGTLHFIAGEDLGWMLQLTTDRLIKGAAARRKQLELTEADLAVARDTALAVLEGGVALERNDLLAEFDRVGVATTGQRGYHLLWNLAQTGVIVFGPVSGKQQTFVLLDEWITEPRRLERDEALGELARRYFTSHGPATVRDLAWWASLTLTEARSGLAIARDQLEERDVDGTTYFSAPGLKPAKKAVFALAGFDEFMLGYQDRSAALAPEHSNLIVPGGNGIFHPTIVSNGKVVGTWRRTSTASAVTLQPEWFADPSPTVKAGFERAANKYGAFLGKQVRIVG